MNNIILFPEKKSSLQNNNDEILNQLLTTIANQDKLALESHKKLKPDLTKLKDKPLIVNNIFNAIDNSRSPKYIKERNKLIIKLLINGISASQIAELNINTLNSLNLPNSLLDEILDFSKLNNTHNPDFIFSCKKKSNKITISVINKIKNKYITYLIKKEC